MVNMPSWSHWCHVSDCVCRASQHLSRLLFGSVQSLLRGGCSGQIGSNNQLSLCEFSHSQLTVAYKVLGYTLSVTDCRVRNRSIVQSQMLGRLDLEIMCSISITQCETVVNCNRTCLGFFSDNSIIKDRLFVNCGHFFIALLLDFFWYLANTCLTEFVIYTLSVCICCFDSQV